MTFQERLRHAQDLENVFLPKIERFIKNERPIKITRSDVIILRSALIDKGYDLEVSEIGRNYLVHGSQFRARVDFDENGEVDDVKVFDRRLKKGDEDTEAGWVSLSDLTNEDLRDEGMFLFPKDKIKDKELGLIELVGVREFTALVLLSYFEAEKEGYTEKIRHRHGTEGRGLQQTISDIFALALLDPKSKNFSKDLKAIVERINTRMWAGYKETRSAKDIQEVNRKFKTAKVKAPSGEVKGFPPKSLPDTFRLVVGQDNNFGMDDYGL